jgi:hypothetical protein
MRHARWARSGGRGRRRTSTCETGSPRSSSPPSGSTWSAPRWRWPFEHSAEQTEISTFGSALFWTSTQLLTVSSSITNPISAGTDPRRGHGGFRDHRRREPGRLDRRVHDQALARDGASGLGGSCSDQETPIDGLVRGFPGGGSRPLRRTEGSPAHSGLSRASGFRGGVPYVVSGRRRSAMPGARTPQQSGSAAPAHLPGPPRKSVGARATGG